MLEILSEGEFWVAVGTALFIAILLWKKVPALAAKALDARAAVIAKELEDARALRDEAQALLDQYLSKRASAESEASAILTEARAEAERYTAEARVALDAQIERRAKQAQDKIAQAEAQAMAEVRALAADAAVRAAEKLIAERLSDARASELVKAALKEIPGKLN